MQEQRYIPAPTKASPHSHGFRFLPITISIDQLKRCYGPSGRLQISPLKGLIICLIHNGKITAKQARRHGITTSSFYHYMGQAQKAGLVTRLHRKGRPDLWQAISKKKIPARHSRTTTFALPRHWRDTTILRTWAYTAIATHAHQQKARFAFMRDKARGQAANKHFPLYLKENKPMTTTTIAAIIHLSPRQTLRHLKRAERLGLATKHTTTQTLTTCPGYHAAAIIATEHNATAQANNIPFGRAGFATVKRTPDGFTVTINYGYRWTPNLPTGAITTHSMKRQNQKIRAITAAITQNQHPPENIASFYDEYQENTYLYTKSAEP